MAGVMKAGHPGSILTDPHPHPPIPTPATAGAGFPSKRVWVPATPMGLQTHRVSTTGHSTIYSNTTISTYRLQYNIIPFFPFLFIGLRWVPWAFCGHLLAFVGLLWACVGLHWPALACVGLTPGSHLQAREVGWALGVVVGPWVS